MARYLLILFLSLPAFGANYYVTQSGAASCASATTSGTPMSVATFNSGSCYAGNNTVIFTGTFTTAVAVHQSGSAQTTPLTLDFTAASLPGPALSFSGVNYVTMLGSSANPIAPGPSNSPSTNIIDCGGNSTYITIQGFSYTGPAGTAGQSAFIFMNAGCSHITISGNTALNVSYAVVVGQGPLGNIDIANNDFESSSFTASACPTQSDVLHIADANPLTIEGNKLVNHSSGNSANGCHNDVIQTYCSNASSCPNGNPGNWTVRYNWIQRGEPDGSGGNMSWDEMEGLVGHTTSTTNCSGAAWAIKYYGNVFIGGTAAWNGGNGIDINTDEPNQTSADQICFFNNTLYLHANPLNPLRGNTGPGTLYFRNNAMGADASGCVNSGDCPAITLTAGVQWNYNFMYNWNGNCNSTYTGPNGACFNSTQSWFTSPSTNNFSTPTGSYLQNKGDSTIGSEYSFGICATATWPNPQLCARSAGNWDAGAYQFTTSITVPTVTTTLATSITISSAVAGGVVNSNGGSPVTAEGVAYGLLANPTSPCTGAGTATPFTATLSPLTATTTYHYRACATNSAGTGYGADQTFTTLSPVPPIYTARTDLNPAEPGATLTSMGGCSGVNNTATDDLGNGLRILRITDCNFNPAKLDHAFSIGIGGSSDTNGFSQSYVRSGHTHYLLCPQDTGSGTYVSDFDATAFSVARPYASAFPSTGGYTLPDGGCDWAYTSFKAYVTPSTIIESVDMTDWVSGGQSTPPSPVNVFDYLENTPGLPDYGNNKCLAAGFAGQTWNDDAAHSKDDQTYCMAFSWYPDWVASTSYPAGTVIRPSTGNTCNAIFYSGGGTSAGSAPTWPAASPCTNTGGLTVTDGSITWTALTVGAGQGTGNAIACYRVGSGCTTLNTTTGAVSGDWGSTGTIVQTDRTLIHNVKISKDGNWLIIQTTLCGLVNSLATCNAAASPEVWQIGTTNMPPLAMTGQHGSGHWTEGYTNWLNTSSFPNPPGIGGYTIRPFSNGSAYRDIYTAAQMPPLTAPWDGHFGWSNADTNDSVPFVGALDEVSNGVPVYSMGQANCSGGTTCNWVSGHLFGTGWTGSIYIGGGTYSISGTPTTTSLNITSNGPNGNVVFSYVPITIGWAREIQAISPITGTTYRFSHTFTSGEDEALFNAAFAIGTVSQDGKFWAGTSDWLGTLGSTSGGTTCTTTSNCRSDVFIFQLVPSPNTPPAPATALFATVSKNKRPLSFPGGSK